MHIHYKTLGVAVTATADEIKQAYRRLASQYHPDHNGDAEKFKQIQAAYDVLGDAEKRKIYDQAGKIKLGVHGFGYTEMADVLKNFSDGQRDRKNKDIKTHISISLEELLSPLNKLISIKTSSGERQTVTVELPLGTNNGSIIKYSGLGDDFYTNLLRGDLYVHVQIDPHLIFEVNGVNLITSVDINAIHAILGTKQVIKTLDNREFELTIPPGTQGDTKFKIANQGLFQKDKITRGHLYVVAKIKIPTNLTPSQLETLKTLL